MAGVVANLVFLLPFWPVWALLPGPAQAVPFFGGLLLLGDRDGPVQPRSRCRRWTATRRSATRWASSGWPPASRDFLRLSAVRGAAPAGRARPQAAATRRLRRIYGGTARCASWWRSAALAAAVPGDAARRCPRVRRLDAVPAARRGGAAVPLRTLGMRAAARRAAGSARTAPTRCREPGSRGTPGARRRPPHATAAPGRPRRHPSSRRHAPAAEERRHGRSARPGATAGRRAGRSDQERTARCGRSKGCR